MSLDFLHGHISLSPYRVFCIGKNYSEHIKELGGKTPDQPVVFMKPVQCLVGPGERLPRPTHGEELHHEVEVVLLLGSGGRNLKAEEAESRVAAVTLGVDLTLRDVQRDLKQKGLPWEAAKAFEKSGLLGEWIDIREGLNLQTLSFECRVNGKIRQHGNTGDMLFPPGELIAWLSRIWDLHPGDLIYTGTPAGVGPIPPGAEITVSSPDLGKWQWWID